MKKAKKRIEEEEGPCLFGNVHIFDVYYECIYYRPRNDNVYLLEGSIGQFSHLTVSVTTILLC